MVCSAWGPGFESSEEGGVRTREQSSSFLRAFAFHAIWGKTKDSTTIEVPSLLNLQTGATLGPHHHHYHQSSRKPCAKERKQERIWTCPGAHGLHHDLGKFLKQWKRLDEKAEATHQQVQAGAHIT